MSRSAYQFSPFTAFAFDEVDDLLQWCAGCEDLAHAGVFEALGILRRNRSAAEKYDIARIAAFQLLDDERKERHVRAGKNREPDAVGVFLNRGLHDLFGRLKESGIDHFH